MSDNNELTNKELDRDIQQYPTGLTKEQVLKLAEKIPLKLELSTEDGQTVDLLRDSYVEASDSEIVEREVTIL